MFIFAPQSFQLLMSQGKHNRVRPFFSQPHSLHHQCPDSTHQITVHKSLQKQKKSPFRPSVFPNPYLKKFNLRKIHRTEGISKSKFNGSQQKSPDEGKQAQKLCETLSSNKNKRYNNIRLHTEKLQSRTNDLSKESPYRPRNGHLQTINHDQIKSGSKYQHLTALEKEEINRYEVLYMGRRRITSLNCFTDSKGDAKIAVGDAIVYRYEVLDILGKGSFGQVFKVMDHKRREIVALKIIRNEPKFCAQAKIEIRLLEHALMKDPWGKFNIVQMKHAFFFRGHSCLVFEHLNQNLYEFLREFNFTGISVDLIVRFTIQILQGLNFLKKYRIVHCDLKPENILLRHKNKTGIKIIDLGSGCFQNEQIYTYIQSRFYRAPEIILGIPYTPAIDMWSLGCIVAELFQGYPIFPGKEENDQIAMFMEYMGVPPPEFIEKGARSKKFFRDFKPKTKSRKEVPRNPGSKTFEALIGPKHPELVNFLCRCFQWNPEQRMTPEEALLHPWILGSLPQEVKKQHMAHLQKLQEF